MRIFDSERLELGEGPGYDPKRNIAWWFDIERSRVYLHDGSLGKTTRYNLDAAGSALAVTEDARYLMVAADGLYLFDPATGSTQFHIGLEVENSNTRSNDARVHPSGHFWVSTMGWNAEEKAGSIYLLKEGRLEPIFTGVTIPNAICFSPAGETGYFTDTSDGRIMKVALDPDTGRPVAAPEVYIADPGGNPDGAVTDAEGNLWVTLFGGGRVLGYNPSGVQIGEISVPAANVTCPAFVGADARQMLVTTALYGLTEAERAENPGAGATFVTEVDIPGRFDPPVKLVC